MITKSLVLDSGRSVQIDSIEQSRIYADLLEGAPTKQMNDAIIARTMRVANKRRCRCAHPVLIPPRRRVPEGLAHLGRKHWFGSSIECLPEVSCIAVLRSFEVARDPRQDASHLTVVWFQDDFAFPIDPGVMEDIRHLDWATLATDFYY